VRGEKMFKHILWYAGRTALALMTLISLLMLPHVANSAPTNKHAVAVIIGNTNYQSRIPSVDFAGNDADAFKRFVIDVQGYDPENIIDLRDATQAQLMSIFGNDRSHEGKLWRYLDPKGRSDITVFYSGHGVPGLKDKRGYLLPVDADAETPEINGFSVDTLLGNLGKLKTKSLTVFLDACFSGDSQKGMLVRATSGITIAPKLPNSSSGMTIITAAQGDQVASWDLKAKHGLFTKHLLDALYGKADGDEYGNGDGKVALGEVREYLDDRMTRAARRQFGRNQNVWAKGDNGTVMAKVIPNLKVAVITIVPKIKAPLPIIESHPSKYKPGNTLKDCPHCPEMVVVPAGEFSMGYDHKWSSKTKPAHLVSISAPFAVGKFEVTQAEWEAIMGQNPSNSVGNKHPVENVSWDDVQTYLHKLNGEVGKTNHPNRYRLLSEAEWEYVARAGTTTKYHFGNTGPKHLTNIVNGASSRPTTLTSNVGQYSPNGFGLFDVHGSVYEWVEDCSNKGYIGAPIDGSAWILGDCQRRIRRGSSSFHRSSAYRDIRLATTGFRVARNLH
jgi:formylglycine-generating enzyme required for sulfatase activity